MCSVVLESVKDNNKTEAQLHSHKGVIGTLNLTTSFTLALSCVTRLRDYASGSTLDWLYLERTEGVQGFVDHQLLIETNIVNLWMSSEETLEISSNGKDSQ
jgi:hypothetical protein